MLRGIAAVKVLQQAVASTRNGRSHAFLCHSGTAARVYAKEVKEAPRQTSVRVLSREALCLDIIARVNFSRVPPPSIRPKQPSLILTEEVLERLRLTRSVHS